MTEKLRIYKCNICGNIVEILHEGAKKLVCWWSGSEAPGRKSLHRMDRSHSRRKGL